MSSSKLSSISTSGDQLSQGESLLLISALATLLASLSIGLL